MALTVYADPLTDADLTTATGKSIRFTPGKNIVMEGCFTFLVMNNVGTFTNLAINLYSDRDGSPGTLIQQSSRKWNRSDLVTTYNNGLKYVGFDMGTKISLNKDTYYHLVLSASSYTFSESAHLAWEKAWPDPIYGQPASWNDLDNNSYKFGIIGGGF